MMANCRWPGCSIEIRGRGLCLEHLRKYRLRTNGDHRSNRTRGPVNPLTEAEIADIRSRLSRFENPKDIAASYGITKSAIFQALKRAAPK